MHIKPDYNGGSIVNLMSTIGGSFDIDLPYRGLRTISSGDLKKYDTIVNIVIDGMGFDYLMQAKDGILKNNIVSKLTSVFPSTTSACITSFATGLAPYEHGVTGWFVRIREKGLDIPSTILLFNDRRNDKLLSEYGIRPDDIFVEQRLSKSISNLDVLLPESIAESVYSTYMLSSANRTGYKDGKEFFSLMTRMALKKKKGRKYIYAYLPDIDAVLHDEGNGNTLKNVHRAIEDGLENFMKEIKGTNTAVLITADHGLIEGDLDKRLNMNELPEISKMLEFPLCGEPRAAYCYVKDEFRTVFKRTVENNIGHAVEVFDKDRMITDGYFGMFGNNPAFSSRIGDFILMCRDNYVIKDFLPGEKIKFHQADHGGLTPEEMFVPLIML